MSVSAYTKAQKKQPSLSEAQHLEKSLLALENACLQILDSQFTHGREDEEGLLWQRKFKNIATPVSLALREHKGPRRFHFHYKHREDDETILHPVMDDPLENLAKACQTALTHCQNDLVGIQDKDIIQSRDLLESALRGVLMHLKEI